MGSKIVANPFDQASRARIYSGEIGYGISNNFALFATLPILSVDFLEGSKKFSEASVGDATVILQYFKRFGNIISPILLSAGLGGNLPIGAGIQNPISSDKNFVSGTVDPILLLSGLYAFEGPFSIFSSLYARPIFFSANDNTKTGSFYAYSLGVNYSFSNQGIDLLFQFRGLHRKNDTVNGELFANSGGDWLYLIPGFRFAIGGRGIHGLQVLTELEIPFYQSVNGTQLTENWTFRTGLSYGFHLF